MSTTPKRPPSPADVKRYRENYQGEVDGVELYRRLARAEKNPERSQIFLDLAAPGPSLVYDTGNTARTSLQPTDQWLSSR